MAEASTGGVAQPGEAQAPTIKVFAKRVGALSFAKLIIRPDADVADLAEAVIAKLTLNASADLVVLKKEDGTVLVSGRTLAAEGVADGTRTIATVVAPPPSATLGPSGGFLSACGGVARALFNHFLSGPDDGAALASGGLAVGPGVSGGVLPGLRQDAAVPDVDVNRGPSVTGAVAPPRGADTATHVGVVASTQERTALRRRRAPPNAGVRCWFLVLCEFYAQSYTQRPTALARDKRLKGTTHGNLPTEQWSGEVAHTQR
jgi:hypothetical protein